MAGLYLHIPFCRSRCLYCAFYSTVGTGGLYSAYIDALLREFSVRRDEVSEPLKTVYIGGGTPSMLGIEDISRLVTGLKEIAGELWQPEEFTIEVNPDDASEEKANAWHSCGINRFSVGTQSFNPEELHRIGRRHTPQRAIDAIGLLHQYGDVSLDLIIGLPGQDMASFKSSMEEALKLSPEHISAYILELEEGSALTRLYHKGAILLPEEEVTAEMYIHLCRRLSQAGYEQYEISNFSKAGHHSRHNSSYWEGTPYLGLGASASSYDGKRVRRTNISDIKSYIGALTATPTAESICEIEHLSDEELREEYLLTRLRRTKVGIELSEYAERFGKEKHDRLLQAALPYLNQKLLTIANGHLLFSGVEGYLHEDAILADLV